MRSSLAVQSNHEESENNLNWCVYIYLYFLGNVITAGDNA